MIALLSVKEAIEYQQHAYGRVVFGRDYLYRVAKSGLVPVVCNGRRRYLFPKATIDQMMTGGYRSVLDTL